MADDDLPPGWTIIGPAQPNKTPDTQFRVVQPVPTPGGGTSGGSSVDLTTPQRNRSGLTDAQVDQALPLIFRDESGNRNIPQNAYQNQPGEINPSTGTHTGPSDASGYAQYLSSTWRKHAAEAGVDTSQYPTAITAPREVQEKVARYTLKTYGTGDWAPYNSTLRKDLVAAGIPVPDVSYSSGNWSPSQAGIDAERKRHDTSVFEGSPELYAQITDLLDKSPEEKKKASLLKSLNAGDEVESPPVVDVKVKGNKAYVTDQDGFHRSMMADEAGVGAIPIAFRGLKPGDKIDTIVTPSGKEFPFTLSAYPDKVPLPVGYDIIGPVTKPTPGWFGKLAQAAQSPMSPPIVQAAGGFAGELAGQRPETLPAALGATVAQIGQSLVEPVISGMVEGGQRAVGAGEQGQDPTRPLSTNTLAAVTALGGIRAPGSGPAAEMVSKEIAAPRNVLADQAKAMIDQRIADNVRGGGPSPTDLAESLRAAHNAGQPLTYADLVKPVRDLLGKAYREPGPARTTIKTALEGRDAGAGMRAEDAIAKYMGRGTIRETQDALIAARSAEAKPLWEKALEGGSIAPLEQQFERVFEEASKRSIAAERNLAQAENRVTQASARQSTAGNVYASNASNRQKTFAEGQARDAKRVLAAAQAEKDTALQRLRAAQADGTANARGAVWSPRIQQFLEEPLLQSGLQRGREIERLDALAENRPIHFDEYAVVGVKPNGDWEVGAVPTFRTLKVTKQGLDALVESERNELTGRLNERGVAIDKVRRQFVAELDRLNPDYKPARDAWSGATSSIAALQYGRKIFDRGAGQYAEDVVKRASEMTANEKEFAKIGIAARMREAVLNVADRGDESKALANSRGARERIRPFFNSEEDAKGFLDFVDRERAMFDTNTAVMGNSLTAERAAEDRPNLEGSIHFAQAGLHGITGNALAAIRSLLRAKDSFRSRSSPELNTAIANEILHYALPGNAGSNALMNKAIQMLPSTRNYLLQRRPTPSAIGTAPVTVGNALPQVQPRQ